MVVGLMKEKIRMTLPIVARNRVAGENYFVLRLTSIKTSSGTRNLIS